jgi:hypothetical protein
MHSRFLFSTLLTLLFAVAYSQPITATITTSMNPCFGGCAGSASINIGPGPGPFSYTWFPSGGNSNFASSLCPGIYTCAVSGGTSTSFFTTIISSPSTSLSSSISGGGCANSATVFVTGGIPAYSFSWVPSGGNSSVITNASPGTYTCFITDAGGCSKFQTVTFTTPPAVSIAGPSTVCSLYSYAYTVSGAATASWTVSAGSAVSAPTATITFPTTTNPVYTVSISAAGTTTSGCAYNAQQTATVYQSPQIFCSSAAMCAGTSHSITTVGALTYSITGNTWLVTPSVTTSYSVIGTSTAGCVSYTPAVTTITVYPAPLITANSPSTCAGQVPPFVLSGASTYSVFGSGANYLIMGWSAQGCLSNFLNRTVIVAPLATIVATGGAICQGGSFLILPGGASTYSITGNNFSVSPTTTTSYSITGTTSFGCASDTAVVTVTVNNRPVVSVGNGTICAGKSYTIVPSGAANYSVSGGNLVVSPITNTVYYISGTSSAGCQSSNTASMSLTVLPLPNVQILAPSYTVCRGDTVYCLASGASTYTWSNGATGYSIKFVSQNNTVLTVTGTYLNGCENSNLVTIGVLSLPYIYAMALPATICAGQKTTIAPGGGISYTTSGGITAGLPFAPSVTGIYTVTGIDGNSCRNSDTVLVTVMPAPNLSLSIAAVTVCTGEKLTVTASGDGSVIWNTGTTGSVLTQSYHSTSLVTMTLTDPTTGCEKADTVKISVDPCTGNTDLDKDASFILFPNPNKGSFTVLSDENIELKILNELGQELKVFHLTNGINRVDLQDVTPGIYFAEIITPKERSVAKVAIE